MKRAIDLEVRDEILFEGSWRTITGVRTQANAQVAIWIKNQKKPIGYFDPDTEFEVLD